jgi:hypothetical protein
MFRKACLAAGACSWLIVACTSSAPPGPSEDAAAGDPTPSPATKDARSPLPADAAVTTPVAPADASVANDAAVAPPDASAGAAGDSSAPSDPGAPAGALESVQVPASGAPVTTKTSLATGEIFLLRATGSVDLGGDKLDAEFGGWGAGAGAAADEVGGADVGIDVGLQQIHAAMGRKEVPPGPGRMKWVGAFRADHRYYMTVTGAGQPLTIKLNKPASAAAGTGAITVALLKLSPAPPALGTALETVMVPVLKVTNTTKLTTDKNGIYILQASGFGIVGGGGTHQGDAEYMDWTVDGAGKNEGEGGVDFGIGVDEPDVGKPSGHNPRLRWWGPWRKDHTYYMVFAGTGSPISFTYHDTGYGDNSKTDMLAVGVFLAP